MDRPRVVVVGELMLDLSIAGRGHDARISVRAGGSAANVAVWAAACRARARVISRLGGDLAGTAIRRALEARGVEVDAPTLEGGHTGTFASVDGETRVDRGVAASLLLEEAPGALDAEVVVISAYLDAAAAVAVAREARVPRVAALGRPLDGADAVCLNREEAVRYTGAEPAGAARALGERFRLACVTDSAAGAFAVLDGEPAQIAPGTTAGGDATGAGDAFAAGLLVALARGASLDEALAEGARCGAGCVASADGWPAISSAG